MLVTQRDVTNNIIKNELHAVSNIMDLVVRDTDTRWSTLLDDKIRTIRESRRQLIQLSAVVISVLNAYAAQAERGHVTTGAAKGMARVWLNHLDLGPRRVAFAYDAEGTVLASTNPRMIDRDLSGIRDFKGPAARRRHVRGKPQRRSRLRHLSVSPGRVRPDAARLFRVLPRVEVGSRHLR